ncbi:MAG TPA: NADH-quinone oxidoreductase subunit N [Thermoanaerobaculia bacterium]|nr:NADH-quinone oxidoreductase subunit N [Thermoanaerobaculia bacterium]
MTLTPLLEPNWMRAILPEIVLSLSGIALILIDAFFPRIRPYLSQLTVLALLGTGFAVMRAPGGTYFGATWEISGLTLLFDLLFVGATLLATLFSREYLSREGLEGAEYYALLLWGTVGMMMMAKGLDLLVVILGLEMLSICLFVLIGAHRKIAISNEASLKYFLMGAFATGFILYGTALMYGMTGSTSLTQIGQWFRGTDQAGPLLTIAVVLVMGGIGFKLALVPFHGWAPDVYQGAPTPVTAWLSTAPKAATLVALVRIWHGLSGGPEPAAWGGLVATLAVLSMVVGNLVAIAQRDLKRMLAYSGIAHVGTMMIAIYVLRPESVAAITIYAFTYTLMNIGAFGVVSLLRKSQNDPQTLDDVAGLGFRHPFHGLALAVCMISLAGVPPTAGFIAKFYLFKVAIEAGATWIALVGILASIVSVYYYLRVVYYLYMKEGDELAVEPDRGVFSTAALAIAIIGIFVIGIFPTPLFRGALEAATLVLRVP